MKTLSFLQPNQKIEDYIESFNGASVQQLIFIPASLGNGVLTDFLNDLEDDQWKELFPKIYERQDFKDVFTSRFDEDRLEALIYAGYYGFIAEIYIPVKSDITFNQQGGIEGYSSSEGHRRIYNVFFTDINELAGIIDKKNDDSTRYDIAAQDKRDLRKEVKNGD